MPTSLSTPTDSQREHLMDKFPSKPVVDEMAKENITTLSPEKAVSVDKSTAVVDIREKKRGFKLESRRPIVSGDECIHGRMTHYLGAPSSKSVNLKTLAMDAFSYGINLPVSVLSGWGLDVTRYIPFLSLFWDCSKGKLQGNIVRLIITTCLQITSLYLLMVFALWVLVAVTYINFISISISSLRYFFNVFIVDTLFKIIYYNSQEGIGSSRECSFYEGLHAPVGSTVNWLAPNPYFKAGLQWKVFLLNLNKGLLILDNVARQEGFEGISEDVDFLQELVNGSGRDFVDEFMRRKTISEKHCIESICGYMGSSLELISIYNELSKEAVSSPYLANRKLASISSVSVISIVEGGGAPGYVHSVLKAARSHTSGTMHIVCDGSSVMPVLFSIINDRAFSAVNEVLVNGTSDLMELAKGTIKEGGSYTADWLRERLISIFKGTITEFSVTYNVDLYVHLRCPKSQEQRVYSSSHSPNMMLWDLCFKTLSCIGYVAPQMLKGGVSLVTPNDAPYYNALMTEGTESNLLYRDGLFQFISLNTGRRPVEFRFDCSVYRSVFWWTSPQIMTSVEMPVFTNRYCCLVARYIIAQFDTHVDLVNKFFGPLYPLFSSGFGIQRKEMCNIHINLIILRFGEYVYGKISDDSPGMVAYAARKTIEQAYLDSD